MEIRMAYPNEIKRIMEIIQDAKESLAQRQVDQWQDGYPDEEIIFEDILESRGYVAVEDQEVVAYAAVYKGNEAAYNEIYDGKWEHDNYMYVTFHRVAVAKEAAGKGVAQKKLLVGLKQLAQKEALTTALRKIKHTKNQQISQAFSHTYLVGAVIVLILSPIALLTDRKSLKS